jgi:hypothetical protein
VLQLPAEDAAALEFQVWVKGFDYICLVQAHRHGLEEPASLLERMSQSTGNSMSQPLSNPQEGIDDRRQSRAVDAEGKSNTKRYKPAGLRQLLQSRRGQPDPGDFSGHASWPGQTQGDKSSSQATVRRSTRAEKANTGSLPLHIVMFGPYMTAKHPINTADYVSMLVWHIAWHTKVRDVSDV